MKSWSISILSVLDDKLLVSSRNFFQMFIFSREGRQVSTVATINSDMLWDATWTKHGNIVYTTYYGRPNKIVVMSASGKVITINTSNQMSQQQFLSKSSDGTFYLADKEAGIYQSIDDGFSWSFVFKATSAWKCLHVIKVTGDDGDDFWALEKDIITNKDRLRVYNMDLKRTGGNLSWIDISTTTEANERIDLSTSSLSYDGNKSIFLSEMKNEAVHVLSVNGQYHGQIMPSTHDRGLIWKLAVDKERQLLFVGKDKSIVKVLKLIY